MGNYDLLDDISSRPDSYIPFRHALYLILFGKEEEPIRPYFEFLASRYNLEYRRKYLIDAFFALDNLMGK